MKKHLLFPLSIVFILAVSCKNEPTRDEVVKQNIEDYIINKMDDPESYEFVSLDVIDSVLYIDNITVEKNLLKNSINRSKESINRIEGYKNTEPNLYDEKEILREKTSILKEEKTLASIDSIETVLGDSKNNVASYTYLYKIRGKNKMGAKVLSEYLVQTGDSLKVINVATHPDKLFIHPNSFPGRKELKN